jgi:16S rRNA (guanine1207-N2)-methyltransferase
MPLDGLLEPFLAEMPRPLLFMSDDAPPRDVIPWSRNCASWPPDGLFACASLRLPRDKGAYEMALHAVASRLSPGAPLFVYGLNDEGIKSAAKLLPPFFDKAETVVARGHGRVWRAFRTNVTQRLRGALADWRRVAPLEMDGRMRGWVSYPGVFAQGGLDAGTALLLAHLPEVKDKTVLDFGAGTGVIARVLVDRGARVTMVEPDAVALEAARENVPEAEAHLGAALPDSRSHEGRFDLIVSNPPIHAGKTRDLTVLAALIGRARRHLTKGGALILVAQKTVPVPRLAEGQLASVRLLVEQGGYRSWELSDGAPFPRV